jgi:hypothetical protein
VAAKKPVAEKKTPGRRGRPAGSKNVAKPVEKPFIEDTFPVIPPPAEEIQESSSWSSGFETDDQES